MSTTMTAPATFGGTKSKQWPVCPEGPQQVVCVDVVDLGMKETEFGDKHKVRLIWQSQQIEEGTGKPYQISGQFTASLHEKATLSKLIESWFGKRLTNDERENGISEDVLIGANGYASITHNESQGRVFANISSIMPLPRGTAPIGPVDYVRFKDREPRDERRQDDL